MKHKSLVAAVLLLAMVIVLAGCNYVSRPVGAGNNAQDSSSMLGVLMQQPTKTIIEETTQVEVIKPNTSTPQEPTPEEPTPEEPVVETPSSPFQVTEDVFTKIEELLQKVSDNIVDTTSATGVSDELMKGRTVYVYTPFDISGKDDAMMKAVASKLNMTVVVNNLNKTGALYSAQMKKIVLSDTKADIMYVDQNTWGDIQYYTQPLTSFVNFELGDKLGTFHGAMSANYTISDGFFPSEQLTCDYYVAAGIGAPYLLAYNKANLVTTGTLAASVDPVNMTEYAEVKLADPVKMYTDGTWGLKAMQQMLINSTVNKRVGLATVQNVKANTGWWFGCDNVAGFKLNLYSKAASASSAEDFYSVAGLSRMTLDTIQDLYWTNTGKNDLNVATFVQESEKDKAITKLFNTYIGTDKATQYAMLGIEASDLASVFAQAGDADWDFVGYPYGTIAENIIRSTEPNEDGNYMHANGEDVLECHSAGWASGFAVLERCANPAIALRFAEDYTVAWQEDYESSFVDLLSKEQIKRYEDMKNNMGVTFYTSMISHVAEAPLAFPGASSKVASDALSASTEFAATPELFTQLIYNKEVGVGPYNPKLSGKWSDFFTTARADGMAGSYQLARVMFNY